jgi:hypothetical protein
METGHTETVVEKVTAYVKDVLGIHPDEPDVVAKPEYSDSEPEIETKDEMLLNPNAYTMKSIGELSSESPVSPGSGGAFERSTEETDVIAEPASTTNGGAPLDPEDAMLMRAVERE